MTQIVEVDGLGLMGVEDRLEVEDRLDMTILYLPNSLPILLELKR